MSGLYTFSVELFLKVPTVLWAVVCLDHTEGKAELFLCLPDDPCCNTRPDPVVYLGMYHPGIQINDRVVIQPSATVWIDVVNSVCLNQFTRPRDMRPSRVIRTNPFLSAIGIPRTLQYSADAAEANADTLQPEVVPDHFGTALQLGAQGEHPGNDGA